MDQALPSGFEKKYGKTHFNGLPYLGEVYSRKEDDPDYRQPVLTGKVNIRQFITSKAEDMKEWGEVMQRVQDGVARISFEDKHYDEAEKAWRILIRWIDDFYTHPEGLKGV